MGDQRCFSDTGFAAFLSEGRLMGTRCGCGELHLPPRALCPSCYGTDLAWEETSGDGRLVAITRMTMVSPSMARQGYGSENPLCVGVVVLTAGPRVVGQVVETDHLTLGTAVSVDWSRSCPEAGLVFTASGAGSDPIL
ncbi:MAG: zinc ribbon domain-containing protein [Planctomycetaceae bacterium]